MAKKKAAKKAAPPTSSTPKSAKSESTSKRPIETYEHRGEQRVNNPPVGLVTPDTDPIEQPKKTYQYDPHLDPQLVWAGKAEGTSFAVPSVSLHVHERIDPKAIIAAVRTNGDRLKPGTSKPRQKSLFEEPEENPPLRDAIDFYKHRHGWSNRLVAGDSLLVMNSLIEKEGMAGKVQMIYIDPPYGIRYGSNFQPFVNRRDVKDGKDEDLSQEPETIKAFRDTWELGIHSYLTYLRDRLLLARELLHESGSVFVQISDENVHHVRELMDEIFTPTNFVSVISFATTSGFQSNSIGRAGDYLIWYSRKRTELKWRPLYVEFTRNPGDQNYRWIMLADGTTRALNTAELTGGSAMPPQSKLYTPDNIVSQGASGEPQPYELNGRVFEPPANSHWKPNYPIGLDRLVLAGRVHVSSNSLRYIRFADDFACRQLNNMWNDTLTGQFTDPKTYVVQTNVKIVQRCILMTTDPGDLVFDPTCGSGTTAFVAEQWGRRWITCDTSRVAITLAKQRLMTASFDYYELAKSNEGIAGGFNYKTVRHVTLKSIANNPEIKEGMTREQIDKAIAKYADQEKLYDDPNKDKSKVRVTGPFTVEAVPAVTVRPIDQEIIEKPFYSDAQPSLPGIKRDAQESLALTIDASVARFGETARQRQWRDELQAAGIRGKGGHVVRFARLEPCSAVRWIHAIGETTDSPPKTVAVSFGPEFAPLEQRQVEQAWEDARGLLPKPQILLFAAFHFDPEAAKDIDELDAKKTGMLLLRAQMNTDLLTDDLKKKRTSNESFWLIGQPDVTLRQLKTGEHKGAWQVQVNGFDYYDPVTGKIESGTTSKIAVWLLDTDYDGRSLFPRQVFFPMSGEKDGWSRLAKNLKAEIDEELIEEYRGTVSLPFEPGDYRRIAVKIVDDRGIESLKILRVE